MLRIYKITGESLLPEYQPGEFVLVGTHPACLSRIHPGDSVIFRHPDHGLLIKNVERQEKDGFFVIGSHPNSVDSRHFGLVKPEDLIGKVLWHIRK